MPRLGLRYRLKALRFKVELFFEMWWRVFEEAPLIVGAITAALVGGVVGLVWLVKFFTG